MIGLGSLVLLAACGIGSGLVAHELPHDLQMNAPALWGELREEDVGEIVGSPMTALGFSALGDWTGETSLPYRGVFVRVTDAQEIITCREGDSATCVTIDVTEEREAMPESTTLHTEGGMPIMTTDSFAPESGVIRRVYVLYPHDDTVRVEIIALFTNDQAFITYLEDRELNFTEHVGEEFSIEEDIDESIIEIRTFFRQTDEMVSSIAVQ